MMLVEPAFGCAAPAVPELLAQVLAKLYAAFPPGTELPQEVGPSTYLAVTFSPARL